MTRIMALASWTTSRTKTVRKSRSTESPGFKTGNENVVVIPRGSRPHDIELHFSDNSRVPDKPEDHIHLSQAEIDTLAYFVKDVAELKENAFYSTSPVLHA